DLHELAVLPAARRAPAVRGGLECDQRMVRELRAAACLERLSKALRDRVPRAVAHLQQALPRGAAAPRETVAPVLAGEPDAELLEPVDHGRRLGRQHLDEP